MSWLKFGFRSTKMHGRPKAADSASRRCVLIALDPALGAEIQKTRPALILQSDVGDEHSPVTIVAAITSSVLRLGPTRVLVHARESGLSVDSVVRLNQIRTVDRRRLVKRLGAVGGATMKRIDQALMISLALIDFEPAMPKHCRHFCSCNLHPEAASFNMLPQNAGNP